MCSTKNSSIRHGIVLRVNFAPLLYTLSSILSALIISSTHYLYQQQSVTMASLTHISKRLTLSYVLDWIVIMFVPRPLACHLLLTRVYSGIAAVGAGFWRVTPNHRPFSPVDPDISFPYVEHEKISTGLLLTIALVIPAIITALVTLVFPPGPGVSRGTPKSLMWRKKLWEWNTAWMGLALALATTFFFTEGLKNVIGKPRPDLLSRCNLDPATVQQYALGGEGSLLPLWNLLVSSTACRQSDASKLNDGFASFPSGHSSCKSACCVLLPGLQSV